MYYNRLPPVRAEPHHRDTTNQTGRVSEAENSPSGINNHNRELGSYRRYAIANMAF